MKRSLLLIALLFAFGAGELQAQAPVKKVLLEEFTGSWCGWCPRGIYEIGLLNAKYSTQFIPVAFHQGDPMQIGEGVTLEATVPGYPDAWFDRLPQPDGTRNTDPTQWDSMMTAHLNDPVVAGVSIKNVKYDPITRALSADVVVNFVKAASGDIRINMYVVEDSVSGPSGTTWDQHNYLTGRAGYESNPFYNLPSVVPGYQHMHVVRAVLGGAWGLSGIVPATVTAGSTYTASFTYTLPANIKPDQARLVGLASAYSATIANNIVFNADQVPVTTLPLITGFKTIAPNQYSVIPRSAQTPQVITLNNTGTSDLQVSIAIDATNSVIPSGWKAVVSSATVTVPAGKSVTDTVLITSPSKANYIGLSVNILPISDKGIAHLTPISVNALSAGTKYISFGSDGFLGTHMDASYNNDFATVPYDANTIKAYPPETFDVGIFPNVNFLDVEGVDGFPPSVATVANTMLGAGKKVFITSTFGMYYAFDPLSPYSVYTGSDASTLFSTTLGVDYVTLKSRSSSGNPTTSVVTGFTGDAVGDGVKFSSSFYQTDVFTISGTATTKPVIYLDSKQSTLGGFRYDDGKGNRLVYLDLNFGLVSGTNIAGASKLITQSMNFLLQGTSDVKSGSTSSFSLDQNYPNPVASETKIGYSLSERTPVSITVHDVLGREVASMVNATKEAGSYSVNFDASKLSAGMYIYTMNAGGKTIEKTMTVTK